MKDKEKRPDWWPENPYPESIFTMTEDEYLKAIPDELERTRISGFLGRFFWGVAEKQIYDAVKDNNESFFICAIEEIKPKI